MHFRKKSITKIITLEFGSKFSLIVPEKVKGNYGIKENQWRTY
jgi:hypothetical protein